MMKKFLLAALLASVATSAFAADLPTHKAAPPLAPIYVAPAFSWTGFYVGVNGGWGFGTVSNSNFGDPNGGLLGAQAGYNYQIGQFVVGVEGDIDWTDMSKSSAFVNGTNKLSTGVMVTDRLRAGVAMDHALIFITGGYAGIATTGSVNDTANGFFGSQDSWHNGGVIGAGLEYAFTNNISAKAEYLYVPMSSRTYFSGTPDAENGRLDISLVRAGLNYKF